MANYQRKNRVRIVDNGFTFFGFVFAWGWLFSKGLWRHGLVVLLLYIPIYFFHSIAMAFIMVALKLPEPHLLIPSLILFSVHFYIGLKGNQWLRAALISKGYKNI
ncbi:MAG: DUF2628 domain-containing protein [Gammaproteobacteria bacterium]